MARIGFEGEVEPPAQQMKQEADAGRDVRGLVNATLGGEMRPVDLGEGREQLVERLPALRLLDCEAARPRGAILRGPTRLPVAW